MCACGRKAPTEVVTSAQAQAEQRQRQEAHAEVMVASAAAAMRNAGSSWVVTESIPAE